MYLFIKSIFFVFFIIFMAGCVRHGSMNAPLVPQGSISESTKDMATVIFYRSSDHFGILKFGDCVVYIDHVEDNNGSWIYDTEQMMLANRDQYMTKDLEAGIHTFSFKGLAKQTVSLEKNKVYYLAVSYSIGGIEGLAFRTKANYLKDTKNDIQIKFKNKNCDFWTSNGCDYEIVK